MAKKGRTAEKAVDEVIQLQTLFSSKRGKDVLYYLCKRFHYFQSSFQGDVNDCLFREGERNVINYIMTQLQASPAKMLDHYRKRLKEEIEYED